MTKHESPYPGVDPAVHEQRARAAARAAWERDFGHYSRREPRGARRDPDTTYARVVVAILVVLAIAGGVFTYNQQAEDNQGYEAPVPAYCGVGRC